MADKIEQSGDHLSIKIISLTDIDLSKLTDNPRVSGDGGQRRVAFFEIHNKSDDPWEWEEDGFQFVTKDGFVMEPDLIRIPSHNLPKGWYSSTVDIPSSAKAKVIVSLGQLDERDHIDYILYKKNLAEAWYSALSDEEVRNYSDKFEEIKLDIPNDLIHELDKLPDI
ncbi:hypothetical protein [Halorubrum trueperi]|uniref:DUF4352 domain-containing protein n=1 Tax=Halorubrum trueperi TaxID=2004704 RepID=A0ABD5URD9_9EURY